MIMDAGSYGMTPIDVVLPQYNQSFAYMPGYAELGAINPDAATYAAEIPSDARADFATSRHNGGLNVGYCDGHAKFMSIAAMYQSSLQDVRAAWSCNKILAFAPGFSAAQCAGLTNVWGDPGWAGGR